MNKGQGKKENRGKQTEKKKEKNAKKPVKKTAKKPGKKGLRERILKRKKDPKERKEKPEEKKEKKPVKVEGKKEGMKKASTEELLRDYEVIIHPLISEKAVNAIETENQLTFVVNKKASKIDVRKAIESMFEVRVDSVRVLRDMKGRKKALVKINKEFKADEIATKLGVL